ncbi:MAG: nicotinate-nucleotide adenylyltransferase [Mobilitalea sp.]
MKKIGIMGGTFDPIHFGHLFLAENAYEQIGLDLVLFMPSQNPPHKAKPEGVTASQRAEMVSIAIKDNPHFELSTMELDREGTTYTADTLTILTRENPNCEYYFIIGADSLFMMHKWWEPQIIFDHCTIIAAGRDNVETEKMELQVSHLKEQYNAKIILIDMPTIGIASKQIRNRIASNKTTKYYLTDEVNTYIAERGLYRSEQGL